MMFALYIILTFASLVLLGAASRGGGRRLWLSLLVFGWTVSQFNTLLEAVVFAVMPLSAALVQLAVAAIAFCILAALAVLIAGKWKDTGEAIVPVRPSLRNLALIILGYEILYWGAGTLVWPFVSHYYLDKGLPPTMLVAALQIPRALIFIGAAWLWLRTNPRAVPLGLGAAFAIMGGIAPMFPDNPYMPLDIRLAHGIETSISNFLFGVLAGYLLRRQVGN